MGPRAARVLAISSGPRSAAASRTPGSDAAAGSNGELDSQARDERAEFNGAACELCVWPGKRRNDFQGRRVARRRSLVFADRLFLRADTRACRSEERRVGK